MGCAIHIKVRHLLEAKPCTGSLTPHCRAVKLPRSGPQISDAAQALELSGQELPDRGGNGSPYFVELWDIGEFGQGLEAMH